MMICKIIMKIITIKIIWIISLYNNNKIKFREEIRNLKIMNFPFNR